MASKKLSDQDKAIWQAITKQIKPLGNPYEFTGTSKAKLKSESAPTKPITKISAFRIGEKTTPNNSMMKMSKKDVTPNMDKKNFQRLQRGKLEIDGKLDLHGLTQEQAKVLLRNKLLDAYDRGKRLILVITGKGKYRTDDFNRPTIGVLKQNVPIWLRQPPLTSIVLEVTQAKQQHGGDGAFYVYLRRKR